MRRWSVLTSASLVLFIAACSAPGEGDLDEEEVAEGEGASSRGNALTYEGQLRGDDMPDGTLHLTFDDGPGARTQELAEYLATAQVSATFFVNGVNVSGRQRALTTIVSLGHYLANHTQEHKLLTRLSTAAALDQVASTDAIVLQAQPGKPRLLRAPYAGWNGALDRALAGSRYASIVGPIHWDVGSHLTETSAADWECWSKKISVERCADLYEQEIRKKGRGMVLLHDIHGRTVEMTKLLVPKLRAEGFRFVGAMDVPSIRRAVTTPRVALTTGQCFSGTTEQNVENGACVESTADGAVHRCENGEWRRLEQSEGRCAGALLSRPPR